MFESTDLSRIQIDVPRFSVVIFLGGSEGGCNIHRRNNDSTVILLSRFSLTAFVSFIIK